VGFADILTSEKKSLILSNLCLLRPTKKGIRLE
jgi:hypothetical protein